MFGNFAAKKRINFLLLIHSKLIRDKNIVTNFKLLIVLKVPHYVVTQKKENTKK
jgi:hypothetical protein